MNKDKSIEMSLEEQDLHRLQYEPHCEYCANSSSCDSVDDHPEQECKDFQLLDKKAAITRILLHRGMLERDDDSADIMDDMTYQGLMDRYKNVLGGTDLELYLAGVSRKVCPNCDGTRVTFTKGGGMAICMQCCDGFVERPVPEGFHIGYLDYSIDTATGRIIYDGIAKEKPASETTERWDIKNGYCVTLQCGKILVSDNVGFVDIGCKDCDPDLILTKVISKDDPLIHPIHVGTWAELHQYLEIPYYEDIELATHGKYVVYSYDKYREVCQTCRTRYLMKLQENAFANALSSAINHISYDPDNLLEKYKEAYPTFQDMKVNVAQYIEDPQKTIALTDNIMPVVYQVIEDFSLIGIILTVGQAAEVINKAATTTTPNDILSRINQGVNSVGLFLFEYILILKEYDKITD